MMVVLVVELGTLTKRVRSRVNNKRRCLYMIGLCICVCLINLETYSISLISLTEFRQCIS